MELALQLGMPAAALARSMSERELGDWAAYTRRHMLPQRRLELGLARIAQLIDARLGSGQPKPLADYLFDQEDEVADDEGVDGSEVSLADLAEMLGAELIRPASE